MFKTKLMCHSFYILYLGAAFNIRDFHYTILSNGPVPLDVLEKIINDWIQTKTQTLSQPEPGHATCKPAGTVSAAGSYKSKMCWIAALVLLLKVLS